MVKLNKIYTRTGDDGTTGLIGGARRLKCDPRVEAYGAIDEANAAIGVARAHSRTENPAIDAALERIQNDLFDLGADLSLPQDAKVDYEPLRIVPHQVEWLEGRIDALTAILQPLKSFVLNGGTPAAAALHLARTIVRRAERLIVALEQSEPINQDALRYVNRLSDYLFVAARALNDNGEADVLWVPGKNR